MISQNTVTRRWLWISSILYNYTKEELQELLDNSDSYADLLRKIGLSEHGNNRHTLRKVIDEYNLDLTQINENRAAQNLEQLKQIQNKAKPLDEILKDGVTYKSSTLLKRLVDEGYKKLECERCGIHDWMGDKLSFHLHHRDGKHDNNVIENLIVLCPNCHSQTENYAGKGRCKIPRLTKEEESQKAARGISEDGQRLYDGYGEYKVLCPICEKNFMSRSSKMCNSCRKKQRRIPKISKEELFELMETNSYYTAAEIIGVDRDTVSRWHKYYIEEEQENNMLIHSDKAPTRDVLKDKIRTLSFCQVGKEYGVSDNAIRKWCDAYGLPRSPLKIKRIPDEEWKNI